MILTQSIFMDFYTTASHCISVLKNFAPLRLCVFALILFSFTNAQTLAPGAPGKDAQWATAGKQGVGTSASLESKVWFTLAQGMMTEVYYPDVTMANVHLLQFVVVNPKTKKVETEQDDAVHEVKDYFSDYYEYQLNNKGKKKPLFPSSPIQYENPDGLASLRFYQINTAKSSEWKITKDYVTDPVLNTILINVQFETKNKDLELYIYYDPSLGNSGMHDTAWNEGQSLLAKDGEFCSALLVENELSEISNGFYQVSDGLEQLRKDGKIILSYSKAENGNVVQIAKVGSRGKNQGIFTVALGFGKTTDEALKTAQNSLKKGFVNPFNDYVKGWSNYVKTLPKVEPKYQAQFNMAAMILKAHEDKTKRGANIASLTIPWGGDKNANENTVGGYHLVWSRDLYQVATAFMALGDTGAANRALDFLFDVQQKADGSFPQNSFLDGKPFWGSLQLDEVAFPLILAYQLKRFDKAAWENHVKKAADFIVKNGPRTPQERWEEEAGYSPSTIAAEIAGLVCAAEIARKNGDEASATIYLAAADDWVRNVERWTATTAGKYGDGNYYLRITQNGNPDAGDKIELNNGAGFYDEREIVDAGFLELVRLGIKSPDDPLIQKSLKVIDEIIKVDTPNGAAFYRYNHDGYGEMDDGRRWNWDGKYTGKGRLWALLSGERGQYELAICDKKISGYWDAPQTIVESTLKKCQQTPKSRLDAMLGFANEGLMIPEQIWDKPETPKNVDKQFVPELKFGEGTGSATPLAWSMAQFIRLAVNLQAGKNLETPDVVYNRYVAGGIPGQAGNFGGTDEKVVLPVKAGETFSFTRDAPKKTKIGYIYGGKTHYVEAGGDGKFTVSVAAPEKEETVVVGIEKPNGATAFERVFVTSADKAEPQKFTPAAIEKIKTAKNAPVIENGKAIFFYRGDAKNVMLAGDFSSWNPRVILQKIGDNLFAYQMDLPNAARAEYKLVVDGNWIADPLNPNKLDNGVGGENSFFSMHDYKPTNWDKGEDVFLDNIDFRSEVYNGVRLIQVYAPKDCNGKPCPVLYLQDGGDYVKRAGAVQTEQNLVAAGKIKPFIMVFLNPKDRAKEYWASDDYAKFLAEEVVPAIDAKYNTIKSRDGRAILGASLGGITSFYVGVKYPEVFSRIGGQSSSFWIDDERVVKDLEKLDAAKTKFRFYIDDGTFEGVGDSRRVNVMLRGKGYPVVYREGETGHNWTSWRDRLADAFAALWK